MCRIFVCDFCCHVGRIVNYVTRVAAKSTDKKTSEVGILINASSLTALQTSDDYSCATPENWQPGEQVIVPPPGTVDAANAREQHGYDYIDWYFSKKSL